MKKAQVEIAAIEFICPNCGEPIPAGHGGHMWTYEDFPESGVIDCPSCKKGCQIPVKARRLLRMGR